MGERLLNRAVEIGRFLHPNALYPAGGSDSSKVRILQIGAVGQVAARFHLHGHEAQHAVVEHHQLHRQFQLRHRDKIAHQHAEAAVAAHRHHGAVYPMPARPAPAALRWPSNRG